MISSDSVPQDEIIRFVKGECQTVSLTPQTLAEVFPYIEKGKLYYIDDESYFVEEKEN